VVPNILILRLVLALASLCFALWGGIVLNISVDTVVWNLVFVVINLVHSGLLLYKMRPIKLKPDLDKAYQMVRPNSPFCFIVCPHLQLICCSYLIQISIL